MNTKHIILAIGIFWGACGGSSLCAAAPQDAKKPEPQAQILTADVDRTEQDGKPKNTFVITGKSRLNIKTANVVAEGEDDASFTVYLTIDQFPPEIGDTLVVQVKDKVFLPYAYGGDANVYWSLELRGVDRTSAEILIGSPLTKAPKDSLTVEYITSRRDRVNGRVEVTIILTNVGKVPLTFYWGTTAGHNNYPCRDTQLSFTATLDGAKVPANPKPLPDGFISSPFTAEPNSRLIRRQDLTQWIQFQKPGKYLIDATYTVDIVNPQKSALPSRWKVSYHNQFSIQIEN